jgi:hypothetical protein
MAGSSENYAVGEQHPEYGEVVFARQAKTAVLAIVAIMTGLLVFLIPAFRRAWRSWLICDGGMIRKSPLKTVDISFSDITTVQAAPGAIQLTMGDGTVHEVPAFDQVQLRERIGVASAESFSARLDAGEKIPFGKNLLTATGIYLQTIHNTVPYDRMTSMEEKGLKTEVWFKAEEISGKVELQWCDTNRDPGLALIRNRAPQIDQPDAISS